jgi:PilZ domain
MTDTFPETPDNVKLHPSGAHGKLRTATGEELPVRAFERGQEVVLVVMVTGDEGAAVERAGHAELEYTSVRGVVKLHGQAVIEERGLIRFRADQDAEVMQRRSFVRVHTPHQVELEHDDEIRRRAHLVDLSGGGMLLADAKDLEEGQTVRFSMRLEPSLPPVNGVARVVRVGTDGKRALVFDEISDRDRQRLIRFVFDCMRHAAAKTRGDYI